VTKAVHARDEVPSPVNLLESEVSCAQQLYVLCTLVHVFVYIFLCVRERERDTHSVCVSTDRQSYRQTDKQRERKRERERERERNACCVWGIEGLEDWSLQEEVVCRGGQTLQHGSFSGTGMKSAQRGRGPMGGLKKERGEGGEFVPSGGMEEDGLFVAAPVFTPRAGGIREEWCMATASKGARCTEGEVRGAYAANSPCEGSAAKRGRKRWCVEGVGFVPWKVEKTRESRSDARWKSPRRLHRKP
jgi:hypothetical protein